MLEKVKKDGSVMMKDVVQQRRNAECVCPNVCPNVCVCVGGGLGSNRGFRVCGDNLTHPYLIPLFELIRTCIS